MYKPVIFAVWPIKVGYFFLMYTKPYILYSHGKIAQLIITGSD